MFSFSAISLDSLFALGFLFRWTTSRGAYIGIIFCFLFTGWATVTGVNLPGSDTPLLNFGKFNYNLNPYIIGVFNHLVLVFVGLVVSALCGGPKSNSINLTFWDILNNRRNAVNSDQ